VNNPTCNDTIVHVHANALLTGSGTTSIVLADLREPQAILAHPKLAALIDFSQPVALLLVAIMHFITAAENPDRILTARREALPAGSYLALSHATADFRPAAAQDAAAVYDQATSTVTLRTRAEVAGFFEGWDLAEPGLVQVPLWRPDGKPPARRAWTGSGSTAAPPARAPNGRGRVPHVGGKRQPPARARNFTRPNGPWFPPRAALPESVGNPRRNRDKDRDR
jgi:hypothetical protein